MKIYAFWKMYKCELAKYLLVKMILCPKFQYYGTCKSSWKTSKASTSNPIDSINDCIM